MESVVKTALDAMSAVKKPQKTSENLRKPSSHYFSLPLFNASTILAVLKSRRMKTYTYSLNPAILKSAFSVSRCTISGKQEII